MDMRYKKVGDKVRLTELVSCGSLIGMMQFIPNGTEVTIIGVYDAGSADIAYRVQGRTNLDILGQGVAFHDETEEV